MPPHGNNGPGYLYDRVAEALRIMIRSGELAPGDRLPPKKRLMQEYGVSQKTVESALGTLIREGLAEAWRGKGTYVTERARWAPAGATPADLDDTEADAAEQALAALLPLDQAGRISAMSWLAGRLGLRPPGRWKKTRGGDR